MYWFITVFTLHRWPCTCGRTCDLVTIKVMLGSVLRYKMNNLGDRVKFAFSPDVILCGWLGSKHQLTNWLTNSCTVRYFCLLVCGTEKDLMSWMQTTFLKRSVAMRWKHQMRTGKVPLGTLAERLNQWMSQSDGQTLNIVGLGYRAKCLGAAD